MAGPSEVTTAGRGRSQWICTAVAVGLVALLLASVARLYHPPYGFTEMIGFASPGTGELPALQAIPHYRHPPWGSYDGQFYAQLALEPLLRDPAIDAPSTSRRIARAASSSAGARGRSGSAGQRGSSRRTRSRTCSPG